MGTKWRLADVIDFEVLLSGLGEAEEARRHREEVDRALGGLRSRKEGIRRRVGLKAWLESKRGEREEDPAGARALGALRLTSWLLWIGAVVAGVGVVRGLLGRLEIPGAALRAYNVWLFLAVTIGLQWLVLVGGAAAYFLVRRQRGTLSVLQRLVGCLSWWFGGLGDGKAWRRLTEGGRTYGTALSWRLGRMTQGAAVAYNLGLLGGFLGCLWLFEIRFFWESTLMSGPAMAGVFDALALPWSWSGVGSGDGLHRAEFDLLEKHFYLPAGDGWPYLAMCLLVWGLLPRLGLWVVCVFGEWRALARLDFQEPRHRELWRKLTRVERSLATGGPADGVVLLDVGGMGIAPEAVKEFLLRRLRVYPEANYQAAVLDDAAEAEAWSAMRKAPLGVVFLVEGWALSPKQMTAIYERVRAGGKDRMLRFLVLGEIVEGVPAAPDEEDFAQWKRYVDGLRDPCAEVVAYEVPEPVGERA